MPKKQRAFNVKVAVRVRPILPHDRDPREVVKVDRASSKPSITVADPDKEFPGLKQNIDYLRVDYVRERSYEFDHVYGPSQTTETVFEEAVEPLGAPVLDGMNVTIFAYGQTGSGKTHTMLGHRGETGVIQLTLAKLFKERRDNSRVTVSFVELYNEEIHDLLINEERKYGNHNGVGGLDLREDPVKGPMICGVTEMPASDVETVMALLHAGNGRRTQESTCANETSSRSHAVLQLAIESSEAKDPCAQTGRRVKIKRSSKLSMIDLAGSERAAETKNSGARLQEGARINRSLLALGNVINALRRERLSKGKSYVNFRDSKLTRLLKDSLGGNCRTLMLAHCSPTTTSFEETLNTLKYANRARAIKNAVKENLRKVEKPARRLRPAAVHPEGVVPPVNHKRREAPRRRRQYRKNEDRPRWGAPKPKTPPRPNRENENPQYPSAGEGSQKKRRLSGMRDKLRARRSVEKLSTTQEDPVSPIVVANAPRSLDEDMAQQRAMEDEARAKLVEQLHRTRKEVVGQVRVAVELRKTVENLTHQQQNKGATLFAQRSPDRHRSPDRQRFPPIKPEERRAVAAAAAAYAAAVGVEGPSAELLKRDPLAFLSDVLLKQKHGSEPKDSSPAGVELTPTGRSPDKERLLKTTTRVKARAARECEGLRRAVKRGLEKSARKLPQVDGSLAAVYGIRDAALRHAASPQPELVSKDELSSSALLDAEMRIVGAELEKLEIAEADIQRPETQLHEREVHEAALKKLHEQVRVRNGVIRKLVGHLKKDGIGARTLVRNSYAGKASPRLKPSPRRESYASPATLLSAGIHESARRSASKPTPTRTTNIMADSLGAVDPNFEASLTGPRKVPRRPDGLHGDSSRRRRPRVAAP